MGFFHQCLPLSKLLEKERQMSASTASMYANKPFLPFLANYLCEQVHSHVFARIMLYSYVMFGSKSGNEIKWHEIA